MRVDIPVGNCCLEPVLYAAVEEDGNSGLVIKVFDDSDKVGADVVLLYGCPQSCMPKPVKFRTGGGFKGEMMVDCCGQP